VYHANVDCDRISAGVLRKGAPPGRLPYYNLIFDQQPLPLVPGLYVVELEIQGLENGALSVPFGPFFDAITPAGAGQERAAFKLAGPFRCTGRCEAERAWGDRPLESRCERSGCELRFPTWAGRVNLATDGWHAFTLAVHVGQLHNGAFSFEFALYLDDEPVAGLVRYASQIPTVYIPEVRNWCCPTFAMRRLRVYFVPAR
jgi:hypothetical protein